MSLRWVVLLSMAASLPASAQTGIIAPGDNLVTDGVPPISAGLADTVRRYAEFRTASFVDWHPRATEMIISTRFADVAQLHRVQFAGGARTQLTFFPDRVSGASYEPLGGTYVVFRKDIGGGEWYQNYRLDCETGAITLLTDGKSRNTLGVWSKDGKRMAYGSTRRNGKDIDFYTVDPLRPGETRLLAQLNQGESWDVLDWSPGDSLVLGEEQISANRSSLWVFRVPGGEKRQITPGGTADVAYGGGQWSPDGSKIYTTTDREGEFRKLIAIDVKTGKQTPVSGPLRWDVDDFDLSRDGRTMAFTTNEDGISVLHFLNLETGDDKPLRGLPIGVVSGIRWHPDNAHLAFTLSSARGGTDVYVVSMTTSRIERWTFSETGGLRAETFAEPELIHWKSFDGTMLSGFMYRPPESFTGKRPAIVVIHGGPEGQSRPTFRGRDNYYLQEMGVALVYPNVRGSTGYGKSFLAADNGLRREVSYKDLASLLDWIKSQGSLDGDRIMVTGGSYGGHATLAIEAFYSDRIRCAVDRVGMSNLVTFLERTEAYRRDLRRAEYGDERDTTVRAFLQRIAPLNNVGGMKKPLFVIQGKNDPRVPVSESEQIVAALKASNTPVWYLMAKDEGHGFTKKRNSDFEFFSTVEFVRRFLLN